MAVRVRVEPTGHVFIAEPGVDLLEVLQANDEPIATSCGGVASCGLCRVTVVSGHDALVPIKPQEVVHLGNVAKVIGLRLACQAQVRADVGEDVIEVVVRVPVIENVEERKRRKAERTRHDDRTSRMQAPSVSPRQAPIEWRPGRVSAPQNGPEGKGGT
jgi:2Fe-2S ferredoxin